MWVSSHFINPHTAGQKTVIGFAPSQLPLCGPAPVLGTTSLLDGGTLQRENVHYGVLAIRNDQPVNVVAVLMDSTMTRHYQVITVGAGSETQVQVPSGQYGFGIMSGRTWCSLDRGFTDGTKHSINGGVTIKPEAAIQTIVGTGAAPGEISVLYRNIYQVPLPGAASMSFAPVTPWIMPAAAPPVQQASLASAAMSDDGKFRWSVEYGPPLLFLGIAITAWLKWRKRQSPPRRKTALKNVNDHYYNPKEFRAERQEWDKH